MNLILGDFLIAVVHSIYNEDQRATFTICILSFQHEKKGVHARVYVEVYSALRFGTVWAHNCWRYLVLSFTPCLPTATLIVLVFSFYKIHRRLFDSLQGSDGSLPVTCNKRIQYGINIVYNVIYMVLHTEFYVILKLMNNQSEIN